jgi:hypothetical protein
MRHSARLARLEQGQAGRLTAQIEQLQQQGLALYEQMPAPMQAVIGQVCDLVVAGDDAGAVHAWQDVITDSPEWAALWAQFDATCDALAACGAYYGGTHGTQP